MGSCLKPYVAANLILVSTVSTKDKQYLLARASGAKTPIAMPPKKKEKTGGNASSTSFVFNEPSQPSPEAEHCLALTIDVCLDGPGPRSDDSSDKEKIEAKDTSEISENQNCHPRLIDPVFRYTFVNGERIVTPPVGKPGSSWTPIEATSGVPGIKAVASSPLKEHVGNVDLAEVQDEESKHIIWRYRRVHQLAGDNDEEAGGPPQYMLRNCCTTTRKSHQAHEMTNMRGPILKIRLGKSTDYTCRRKQILRVASGIIPNVLYPCWLESPGGFASRWQSLHANHPRRFITA